MKAFPVRFAVGAALSVAVSLSPYLSVAEDFAKTAAVAEAKPALDLKVLDSVEVKYPDHSVFYQRVAPPVPPLRLASAPEAKPLSPEEMAVQEARAKKKFEVLMLFATVYDRRFTELRWSSGERQYRAWSSVDFNDFAASTKIETEDTVYLLMLGLGNETSAGAATWRKDLPAAELFDPKRSGYLVAGAEKEPTPEALAPLDVLHVYYDANRDRLHQESEHNAAERLAREQALEKNPPKPPDTVIRFWPKKSRTYPTYGQ